MATANLNHARITAVRSMMANLGLELALAYSTRFASAQACALAGVPCRSAGNYLVISPDDVYFVEVSYKAADLRARTSLRVATVSDENLYPEFLANLCEDCSAIGILGPIPYLHLSSMSASITDLSAYLWPILKRKNEDEVAALQRAYRALKKTVDRVCHSVYAGQTEQQLANALRLALSEHADRLGFDPLITSGNRLNTSTFLSPSDRQLKLHDFVCLDIGTVVDGLYTDTTHLFRLGVSEDPTLQALKRLQEEVVSELEVGMPINELESIYQRVAAKRGLDASSIPIEDLGHFIGFELHEPPFFVTQESKEVTFEEGHVFCLEPQVTVGELRLRTESMVVMRGGVAVLLDEWQ